MSNGYMDMDRQFEATEKIRMLLQGAKSLTSGQRELLEEIYNQGFITELNI